MRVPVEFEARSLGLEAGTTELLGVLTAGVGVEGLLLVLEGEALGLEDVVLGLRGL